MRSASARLPKRFQHLLRFVEDLSFLVLLACDLTTTVYGRPDVVNVRDYTADVLGPGVREPRLTRLTSFKLLFGVFDVVFGVDDTVEVCLSYNSKGTALISDQWQSG